MLSSFPPLILVLSLECRGRRVTFIVEEKVLPNGHKMKIDKVVFPDAVAVLPVYTEGTIVLIKQYRPVIDKYIYEAPAGVIDPGEAPIEAAKRELEEETGLKATNIIQIGSGYTTPGYSTEKLYLFLAIDPEEGEARPEEHEIIRREVFTIKEAIEMIESGEIEDIKTIALVLSAERWLSKLESE